MSSFPRHVSGSVGGNERRLYASVLRSYIINIGQAGAQFRQLIRGLLERVFKKYLRLSLTLKESLVTFWEPIALFIFYSAQCCSIVLSVPFEEHVQYI